MRPTQSGDDDWLFPEPPTSNATQKLPAFAGVWRIEQQGEDGIPFPTLVDALAEPPTSQEAEIRGEGGCLAQPCPDVARWLPTATGRERIEREIRGMEAA